MKFSFINTGRVDQEILCSLWEELQPLEMSNTETRPLTPTSTTDSSLISLTTDSSTTSLTTESNVTPVLCIYANHTDSQDLCQLYCR